jgi:hypothetical protein
MIGMLASSKLRVAVALGLLASSTGLHRRAIRMVFNGRQQQQLPRGSGVAAEVASSLHAQHHPAIAAQPALQTRSAQQQAQNPWTGMHTAAMLLWGVMVASVFPHRAILTLALSAAASISAAVQHWSTTSPGWDRVLSIKHAQVRLWDVRIQSEVHSLWRSWECVTPHSGTAPLY